MSIITSLKSLSGTPDGLLGILHPAKVENEGIIIIPIIQIKRIILLCLLSKSLDIALNGELPKIANSRRFLNLSEFIILK